MASSKKTQKRKQSFTEELAAGTIAKSRESSTTKHKKEEIKDLYCPLGYNLKPHFSRLLNVLIAPTGLTLAADSRSRFSTEGTEVRLPQIPGVTLCSSLPLYFECFYFEDKYSDEIKKRFIRERLEDFSFISNFLECTYGPNIIVNYLRDDPSIPMEPLLKNLHLLANWSELSGDVLEIAVNRNVQDLAKLVDHTLALEVAKQQRNNMLKKLTQGQVCKHLAERKNNTLTGEPFPDFILACLESGCGVLECEMDKVTEGQSFLLADSNKGKLADYEGIIDCKWTETTFIVLFDKVLGDWNVEPVMKPSGDATRFEMEQYAITIGLNSISDWDYWNEEGRQTYRQSGFSYKLSKFGKCYRMLCYTSSSGWRLMQNKCSKYFVK